jgi:hypothetical protein
MRSTYRLLQIRPDIRRSDVVTIGAFLRLGAEVQFVKAPSVPGAKCLGSAKAAKHLDYVLESVARTSPEDWWEGLPSVIGRGVQIGTPHEISVEHPTGWLRRELLPNFTAERSQSRRPNRTLLGKQFFENQGVGRFVNSRHNMENTYHVSGLYFPNFSLVTAGASDVLLIEPLKFGRETFEGNAKLAAQKFQAAKYAREKKPRNFASKPFATMTVLLPGITDEGREIAEERAGESTDFLVDSRDPSDRKMAREMVLDIGQTAASIF